MQNVKFFSNRPFYHYLKSNNNSGFFGRFGTFLKIYLKKLDTLSIKLLTNIQVCAHNKTVEFQQQPSYQVGFLIT